MKHIILQKVIKNINNKPQLRRKLKWIAGIGAMVFVLTAGLVLWAAIAATSFVASKATQVAQAAQAQPLPEISGVQLLPCWQKTQSLLAVEPWLAKPALDNLKDLKTACLTEVKPI